MITDEERFAPAERTRRRWPWAVLAVLAVVAVAYVGSAWALSDRVPRGVEVSGVPIGHLTRDAAVERLDARLAQDAAAPVEVEVGAATEQVDPGAAGLSLDLEQTVDSLVGFTLDPRRMWRHAAGDRDVEPVASVDEQDLDTAVEALAGRVDADVVEGAVTFADGVAVATPAQEGRTLDREAAADVLAEGWYAAEAPLELPAEVRRPAVGQAEVDRAMAEFAAPATAGPLTVAVGERVVEVAPAAVTPALSMEPVDGRLQPRVDGAVLLTALLEAAPDVVVTPSSAGVRIESGRPVVVPARNGTSIDPAALADAALAALPTAQRTAVVQPVVAEPEVTTAQAESWAITEVVSSFSSTLTDNPARTENIRIAAREVDGTVLSPGETFSLNETLGPRTAAKGYNEAGVIMNGRLTEGRGGGVSQVSTTLFNGMFFAGLEDVEHKPHSFYISRYPEGRESTLNWPNIDLKFRNTTPYGVLIEMWVSGGQVHTRFWSTQVYDDVRSVTSPRRNLREPEVIRDDSPDCVPQSPNAGFDVTVTRRLVQDGSVVGSDEFVTRYIPQDRVICT